MDYAEGRYVEQRRLDGFQRLASRQMRVEQALDEESCEPDLVGLGSVPDMAVAANFHVLDPFLPRPGHLSNRRPVDSMTSVVAPFVARKTAAHRVLASSQPRMGHGAAADSVAQGVGVL